MKIEWCVHNESLGTRRIIERLHSSDAKQVTFARYACTEDCALCCREAFVRIDDTMPMHHPCADVLFDLVRQYIDNG